MIKPYSRTFMLLCFALLGGGAVFLCTTAALALEVQSVRLGFNPPKTRFVLEVNERADAKLFTLQNPPRLVVDIPSAAQKVNLEKLTLPEEGVVLKVRDGVFSRSTHRFVLELKQSVTYSKFLLPPQEGQSNRIVIDLKPKNEIEKKDAPAPYKLTTKEANSEKKQPPSARSQGGKKPFVIIVDAGHGGIDPGALGKRSTREKDVVLAIARKLAANLNKQTGVKAYLTRDSDVFLKLQERVDKAKALKADLFVSLHADAHKSRAVRGGSVYVLSESASEREAERLSILANRGVPTLSGLEGAGKDGIVQDILIDLAQRDTMNNSAFLAKSIIEEMGRVTHMRRTDILFAGFKVLKAPDIPSILVELAYMSNLEEEKKLRTASFQNSLASSIAKGILQYHTSLQ